MNNKTREYRACTVVIDVANNKLVSSSHRCADDVADNSGQCGWCHMHCRVMLTEESLHYFFLFASVPSLLPCSLSDAANSFDDGTAGSYFESALSGTFHKTFKNTRQFPWGNVLWFIFVWELLLSFALQTINFYLSIFVSVFFFLPLFVYIVSFMSLFM